MSLATDILKRQQLTISPKKKRVAKPRKVTREHVLLVPFAMAPEMPRLPYVRKFRKRLMCEFRYEGRKHYLGAFDTLERAVMAARFFWFWYQRYDLAQIPKKPTETEYYIKGRLIVR